MRFCAHCGMPFSGRPNRLYCEPGCRVKAYDRRRTNYAKVGRMLVERIKAAA